MADYTKDPKRYVRWSMTVYEGQWHLLAKMPEIVKAWGWQDEICPKTNRPHKQGYIHTRQCTFNTLRTFLKGPHIEPIPFGAKGKNGGDRWKGLLEYCQKEATRAPGAVPVHQDNFELPPTQSEVLLAIAKHLYWAEDQREAYLLDMEGMVLPSGLEKRYLLKMYWLAANRLIVNKPHWGPQFARVETEKLWIRAHKAYRNIYINSIKEDAPPLSTTGGKTEEGLLGNGGGDAEQTPQTQP